MKVLVPMFGLFLVAVNIFLTYIFILTFSSGYLEVNENNLYRAIY